MKKMLLALMVVGLMGVGGEVRGWEAEFRNGLYIAKIPMEDFKEESKKKVIAEIMEYFRAYKGSRKAAQLSDAQLALKFFNTEKYPNWPLTNENLSYFIEQLEKMNFINDVTELDLSGCALEGDDSEEKWPTHHIETKNDLIHSTLLIDISSFRNLKKLDLSKTKIWLEHKDVYSELKGILNRTKIDTLILQDCPDVSRGAIYEMYKGEKIIKNLDISNWSERKDQPEIPEINKAIFSNKPNIKTVVVEAEEKEKEKEGEEASTVQISVKSMAYYDDKENLISKITLPQQFSDPIDKKTRKYEGKKDSDPTGYTTFFTSKVLKNLPEAKAVSEVVIRGIEMEKYASHFILPGLRPPAKITFRPYIDTSKDSIFTMEKVFEIINKRFYKCFITRDISVEIPISILEIQQAPDGKSTNFIFSSEKTIEKLIEKPPYTIEGSPYTVAINLPLPHDNLERITNAIDAYNKTDKEKAITITRLKIYPGVTTVPVDDIVQLKHLTYLNLDSYKVEPGSLTDKEFKTLTTELPKLEKLEIAYSGITPVALDFILSDEYKGPETIGLSKATFPNKKKEEIEEQKEHIKKLKKEKAGKKKIGDAKKELEALKGELKEFEDKVLKIVKEKGFRIGY